MRAEDPERFNALLLSASGDAFLLTRTYHGSRLFGNCATTLKARAQPVPPAPVIN